MTRRRIKRAAGGHTDGTAAAGAYQFVDVQGACALLKLSRSSFYRAIKCGRLPAPVKLNSRVARWRVDRLIVAFERGTAIRRGVASP